MFMAVAIDLIIVAGYHKEPALRLRNLKLKSGLG